MTELDALVALAFAAALGIFLVHGGLGDINRTLQYILAAIKESHKPL